MDIYYIWFPLMLRQKIEDATTIPYEDERFKIFYPKPEVKETDFRSGKEKRRDRRKNERNKKKIK